MNQYLRIALLLIAEFLIFSGSHSWTRTSDRTVNSRLLYRTELCGNLPHKIMCAALSIQMAERQGLEP